MRCTNRRAETIVKGFEKTAAVQSDESKRSLLKPYVMVEDGGNVYTHMFDGLRVMRIKGRLKADLLESEDRYVRYRNNIKSQWDFELPTVTAIKKYMKENGIRTTSPVWKQTYRLSCGVVVQVGFLIEALELMDNPQGFYDKGHMLNPIKITDDNGSFAGICPVRIKSDSLAYNERVECQALVTLADAAKIVNENNNPNLKFWYNGAEYMFASSEFNDKLLLNLYADNYEIMTTAVDPCYKKLNYMDEVWVDKRLVKVLSVHR